MAKKGRRRPAAKRIVLVATALILGVGYGEFLGSSRAGSS